MATAQQFEDLQVWQDARKLVREIYKVTKQRAFRRDFSLRDQITRASTSTLSNIAEGFERGTPKEFIQFLILPKDRSGKFARIFMWPLTRNIWTRSLLMHYVLRASRSHAD